MKKYVYFIKNKSTGLKYIGAKYSKTSDPKSFWVDYFTSSKHIKKLIDVFGVDDFTYKILKTFDSAYSTLKYENHLIRLAIHKDDYLNLHCNFIGEMSEEEYLNSKDKQKKIAKIYGDISYITKTGMFALSDDEKNKACSDGGRSAAIINKKLNRAIFNAEVREKQHKTLKSKGISAYYDVTLRSEICSKGGKNGYFSKKYYDKNGLSENERIEAQRRRGKKGGPKNKGFIWYNDGTNIYKYTTKQQKELTFDVFLDNNPQYIRGSISTSKGKIWVNDGTKNYMIHKETFNKEEYSIGRLGNKDKYNGHKNKKNNKN